MFLVAAVAGNGPIDRQACKTWFFVCLVAVCLINGEAFAMSVLKGEEVCIFSGFEARLTYMGEPAVGARVVRHVNWKDQEGESDETVTDSDGNFGFQSRWDTLAGLRKVLPNQFVAHQSIFVYYKNKEFQIWGGGKLKKAEYSEFGGKPVNFHCELSEEVRRVDLPLGFMVTNCHWDIQK